MEKRQPLHRPTESSTEEKKERIVLAAYKKAADIIREDRIIMDDFHDIYGTQIVRADQAYVRDMRARFRDEETDRTRYQKKRATILEAILLEQIDQSMWWGEGVTTRATAEYDDIKNGVDILAAVDLGKHARSYTGLAIDVTFNESPEFKIERVLEDIRRGVLATIKYAETPDIKGTMQMVPRVVLATSTDHVDELSQVWVDGKRNDMAKHPVSLQFAEQIIEQLHAYRNYALKHHKKNVADAYSKYIEIWQNTLGNTFSENTVNTLRKDSRAATCFEHNTVHMRLLQKIQNI
jgi:hypothetical protein